MIKLRFPEIEINLTGERLVIFILDSMRCDVFERNWHIEPQAYFKCKAIDNFTTPVMKKWAEFVKEADYPFKAVVCGGGYASAPFARWEGLNFYLDRDPFPLLSRDGIDLLFKQPLGDSYLIIIHDYYIHNYWEEIGIPREVIPKEFIEAGWKDKKEFLFKVYEQRTRELIGHCFQVVEEYLLRELRVTNIVITSDHGEAFYEDGVHYFHGPQAGYCKEVMEIPFAFYGSV